MMLAVVGFPDLEADDRHWIESFRAAHDPHAGRLSVHFTFVFPIEVALEELEAEVADVADITAPIAFEIQRTEVVADAFGRASHVFLVPDHGGADIKALHERLYAGALRVHHRLDIPYVPHMTVATAADSSAARRVADELDLRQRYMRGTISALDIVDVSAPRVRSVGTYPLRSE